MHSAGGPFGWLMADARPELVKAVVSVEGLPPAMAAAHLTFDPPGEPTSSTCPTSAASSGARSGACRASCRPTRRAGSRTCAGIPIACLHSDDPRFSEISRVAALFLRQAGCTVDDLWLADHGITGNSHFMTLEDNSREVLGVALRWLDEPVP